MSSSAALAQTVVAAEAAKHVEELGLETVLDCLVAYTRDKVTGLRGIRVELAPAYDTGGDDAVVIEAIRDADARLPDDPTSRDWGRWFVTTFPPEVRQHFSFATVYGSDHAG